MKTTPTEVKDAYGDTIGWIKPVGTRIRGVVTYEYHCTSYRTSITQTRTFSTFNSAKNFIETGKTTLCTS